MTNQRCAYNYHSNHSITYNTWNKQYKVIKWLSVSNVSLWCEANRAEFLLVNSPKISSNKSSELRCYSRRENFGENSINLLQI